MIVFTLSAVRWQKPIDLKGQLWQENIPFVNVNKQLFWEQTEVTLSQIPLPYFKRPLAPPPIHCLYPCLSQIFSVTVGGQGVNERFPTKSHKGVLYLDTDKWAMSLLRGLPLHWLCPTCSVLIQGLPVTKTDWVGEEEQRRWGKWEAGLKWTGGSCRHKHDPAKLSLPRMWLKAKTLVTKDPALHHMWMFWSKS